MAIGAGVMAAPQVLWANKKTPELFEWQGRALGAETSIQLYSSDKGKADEVLKGAQQIIQKYENLFSLYQDSSHTSLLNKNSIIEKPELEFLELIELSKKFNQQTDGAFDISIQPLWDLYIAHFSGNSGGNIEEKLEETLELIGSDKIIVSKNRVSFAHEDMAVSFNGIAQGYITDKVTEYLKSQGFENTLVDIGEYRAGGPQENGQPWRIGLLDPFDAVSIADVIEMDAGAVATSGGYGNQFDASGKYHHLFDPRSGRSSALYVSVTVKANDATTADALSTAFSNMSENAIKNVLNPYDGVAVRLTDQNGRVRSLQS